MGKFSSIPMDSDYSRIKPRSDGILVPMDPEYSWIEKRRRDNSRDSRRSSLSRIDKLKGESVAE